MSRLIIIEPYEHLEVLERWLPPLLGLGFELECWLPNEALIKKLMHIEHASLKWCFPSRSATFDEWFQHKAKTIQVTDQVLWLTSGLRYDRLLYLPVGTHLLLVVHNAQSLFSPKLYWPPTVRSLRSLVGYLLKRQWCARRRLLKLQIDFIFPTAEMAIVGVDAQNAHMRTHVWPFSYASKKVHPLVAEKKTIVVPGAVKPKLRDYALLEQALVQFFTEYATPLRLVFLGACQHQDVVSYWQKFAKRYAQLELITFAATVSGETYTNWMAQAALVWLPLKQTVRFGPFAEHLGQSKVSGGVYDAIYYRKPLMVPDFYPCPKSIPLSHFYSYNSVLEAAQLLEKAISTPVVEAHVSTGFEQLQEQMYLALSRSTPA